MQCLSSYTESLRGEAKIRYPEKISAVDGIDLFYGCVGEPVEAVPSVEASDLVPHLVLQTNFLTAKQFKAQKSLEAYNQFVCGWIKDMESGRKIHHNWTSTFHMFYV